MKHDRLNGLRLRAAAMIIAAVLFFSIGVGCSPGGRTRRTVEVPMRDGVHLVTDLYFPERGSGPYPVILIRTPYKKERYREYAPTFTQHGYVVAVQDVRGRFASPGEWEPFVREGPDGYDTIEWLASREWSSGKVGMIGASYDGWVQYAAAVEKPPHLATIIPNVCPPDLFFNIPYEYGVFVLNSLVWIDIVESRATDDPTGKAMEEIRNRDWRTLLRSLPVAELDEKIFGRVIPYYRTWIEHPTYDSYWTQTSCLERLRELDIPVFIQSGWFDENTIGSKQAYLALTESKSEFVKLIIGPWGHTPFSSTEFKGRFMGHQAGIDLNALYVRWFDNWLKGADNGILDEHPVQIYAVGSYCWIYGSSYPIPNFHEVKLYLHSHVDAAAKDGGGELRWESPESAAPFDTFTYHPADPPPSCIVYLAKNGLEAYERDVSSRGDVLVYETPPVEGSVIIAGPMSVVLHASSSAKDTDWFVTLYEVDGDGDIAWFLARGMIRARFRDSMTDPTLLEPGEIYMYTIDLMHTGYTLPKGHRLRMEISSALFPPYARNLGTGGHNEMETEYVVARQKIYHSKTYPSYLLIPVIDPDDL